MVHKLDRDRRYHPLVVGKECIVGNRWHALMIDRKRYRHGSPAIGSDLDDLDEVDGLGGR